MILSPCKDCTDRHIGCHSTCEKYIDFRKRCDKEREDRLRNSAMLNTIMYANHRRMCSVTKSKNATIKGKVIG